jgi:uncharacterized membrane protein
MSLKGLAPLRARLANRIPMGPAMKPTASIATLTQRNVDAINKLNETSESSRTLGERVADSVAATVGSWPFIIIQSIVLVIWMGVNVAGFIYQWDNYPFILLNLVLSFQAAYASPIIMMSQNRQNKLAERRNQLDLQINLLSEQENTEMLKLLRLLCEKSGVDVENHTPSKTLEQTTSLHEVARQIDEAEERKLNSSGSA